VVWPNVVLQRRILKKIVAVLLPSYERASTFQSKAAPPRSFTSACPFHLGSVGAISFAFGSIRESTILLATLRSGGVRLPTNERLSCSSMFADVCGRVSFVDCAFHKQSVLGRAWRPRHAG
jgi:hypothetical protein